MPRHRHDPSKDYVGFYVGDVTYAVRIELVREIVNPLEVIALPRAPASVRGVADYRGEVVPVVDLRERFGLPAVPPTRRQKWIVVDVGQAASDRSAGSPPPAPSPAGSGSGAGAEPPSAEKRFAALVVDAVTEVFGSGGAELRPAPPLGAGDDVRGIAGVTHNAEGLVFVLEARAFGALADEAIAAASVAPAGFEDSP
jgi:purine-binding chemotaxis protein CheW